MKKLNQLDVNTNKVIDSMMNESVDVELKEKFELKKIESICLAMTTKALAICESYNSGNGKFDNSKLPVIKWARHSIWLVSFGLFHASKMESKDVISLINNNAVSDKHAHLLAKQCTGKYDFTGLLAVCTFINKIDSNLQSFTFKRESKTCKVDLSLLTSQLELMGLELITEEQNTRSGGKIINYFYDVITTKG
jgi:hypothetical protein